MEDAEEPIGRSASPAHVCARAVGAMVEWRRGTHVAVEKVLEVDVEVVHPLLEVGVGLAIGDGTDEEIDEPVERVLVHCA